MNRRWNQTNWSPACTTQESERQCVPIGPAQGNTAFFVFPEPPAMGSGAQGPVALPCAPQGPGPEGIFAKGAFAKGAFAKAPVLIRPVARNLFSSVSPGGLVPGAWGAGHAPGTGTTAHLDNCTTGSTRTSGTTGKGRGNRKRDNREKGPQGPVPGIPGTRVSTVSTISGEPGDRRSGTWRRDLGDRLAAPAGESGKVQV